MTAMPCIKGEGWGGQPTVYAGGQEAGDRGQRGEVSRRGCTHPQPHLRTKPR